MVPGVTFVNDTVMDPSPGHTICLNAVNTHATGAPLPAGFSEELVRPGPASTGSSLKTQPFKKRACLAKKKKNVLVVWQRPQARYS